MSDNMETNASVLTKAWEYHDRLVAENAKLRAALEDVAKQQHTDDMSGIDYKYSDFAEAYDMMIDVAKAALTPIAD